MATTRTFGSVVHVLFIQCSHATVLRHIDPGTSPAAMKPEVALARSLFVSVATYVYRLRVRWCRRMRTVQRGYSRGNIADSMVQCCIITKYFIRQHCLLAYVVED